jgi:hypothetical protein
VYGADVSATLTDPDCEVSSSLYFLLLVRPPHSQIRIARPVHLFLFLVVSTTATLTDPDCKVSSSLYFLLLVRPPHSQIQTARSVHLSLFLVLFATTGCRQL